MKKWGRRSSGNWWFGHDPPVDMLPGSRMPDFQVTIVGCKTVVEAMRPVKTYCKEALPGVY